MRTNALLLLLSEYVVKRTSALHESTNPFEPAWRSPRAWAVLLLVLVAGLAVDLVSKSWSFRTVAGDPVVLEYERVVAGSQQPPWHEGVQVLPWDLLDFHLVLNRGAVFGLGQGSRLMFIAFTVVAVVVAIAVFGWWTRKSSTLAHVAIALILAGGLGNLYDRFAVGAVRDFLHMFPRWNLPFGWNWPGGNHEVFPWIFNVADMLLLSGMALLLLHVNLSERKQRDQAPVQPEATPQGEADRATRQDPSPPKA